MGKADIIIGFSLLFVSRVSSNRGDGASSEPRGYKSWFVSAIALGGLMVLNLFLILRGLKQRRKRRSLILLL